MARDSLHVYLLGRRYAAVVVEQRVRTNWGEPGEPQPSIQPRPSSSHCSRSIQLVLAARNRPSATLPPQTQRCAFLAEFFRRNLRFDQSSVKRRLQNPSSYAKPGTGSCIDPYQIITVHYVHRRSKDSLLLSSLIRKLRRLHNTSSHTGPH